MRTVTPPDEDIGVVEDFLRQAVFRHIEGRGADVVFFVASERFGYCAVNAAGYIPATLPERSWLYSFHTVTFIVSIRYDILPELRRPAVSIRMSL